MRGIISTIAVVRLAAAVLPFQGDVLQRCQSSSVVCHLCHEWQEQSSHIRLRIGHLCYLSFPQFSSTLSLYLHLLQPKRSLADSGVQPVLWRVSPSSFAGSARPRFDCTLVC